MPKLAKIYEKSQRRHVASFLRRLKKDGTTTLPFVLTTEVFDNKNVYTLGDKVGFSRQIPPIKVKRDYLAKLEACMSALDNDIEEERLIDDYDDPIFKIKSSKAVSTSSQLSMVENTEINYSQLRTLEDLNIDTSFLEYFEKQDEGDETDKMLRQNGVLIMALEKEQVSRLTKGVVSPTVRERQLADSVMERLSRLSLLTDPGQLVSSQALHHVMGIAI